MTGSNCVMRLQSCEKVMGWCTAQCNMLLFCMKTIMKESYNFELACLKKKKRERSLVTFWFSAFAMLFCTTRHVVGHEAFENEW